MPSLVTHLLVPPLVLLATQRFDWRLVLLLLPLSLVPDLDFFVPPHRALFHSAFLVAALLALWWRWRPSPRPGPLGWGTRADAALLAAFFLASHSLMDLFVGGVVPFWPLTDQNFFVEVQVLFDTRTLTPYPTFQPGTEAGVPQVSPIYEFLNPIEFGMLVLTLLVGGVLAVRRALRVEREVVVRAD